MDIESIKTFMVLAKTKNYTRAANHLFVAQSTVTNRINELEKELEFKLFRRTNRSVELTSEGEKFRLYAEKVIELTDTSLSEISSKQKYSNYLRIGCADSIYEGHLASLIQKHRKSNPSDYLKISIGLSDHLLEQIQNHLSKRTGKSCAAGAVLFSNQYGYLGETEQVRDILTMWETNTY